MRLNTRMPKVDLGKRKFKADGGYGWIVCCGTFIVNFVVFGIHNSFGVLYVSLLDDLNLGEMQTAWIGAMAMGLNFFFGPITSALCDRFGCRVVSFAGAFFSVLGLLLTSFVQEVSKMYVTYGVVWGVGSSLSFVSSIVVLGQYFKKRLALANGIATSGSGVGSLVAGPVINFLLQTVGWKSSMRILSGFAGILWMAALLFKPREIDDADRKEHTKLFDTSVWKNKAYVLWVTTVALFQFGYLIPFVHLVKFAEDLGIPKSKGAWLIGFLSITSTVGRVLFGKLSDMRYVNRLYLYQFAVLSIGVITAMFPLARNYPGLVGCAVMFGFFDGCFVGQVAVVTADVVGHEKLSQAVGNMFGTLAIPLSLGPPLAGWLHEGLGSYNEAFYVSGTVAIFSALLVFGVGYMSRKHRNAILTRNREPTRGSSECSSSTSELGLKDVETQPILHEDCEVKGSEIPGGIRIRDLLLVIDRETVL
ncbi:monocarboxylate transporter 10-like isoform X1 [Montipora capricornis]|uniref:monocarboxylate transporter 10-like isoform X1 n=1 Tax=Montipora capricornis TaxID=246305 RepID=UPI0035F19796